MSHPVYIERQFASVLWIVLPVISLLVFMFHYNAAQQAAQTWALGIVVLANALILLLLGRLTISIDATHLRWHFGFIGWPAWSIPLAEIAGAEATSSRWIEGWGIKYTKQGMLYNAAGTAAVRIRRRNGKSLRLGCSDPRRLLSFLAPRITPVVAAATV
ncbi:MAG: hypothetical protein V4488_02030 [Pseudomonadota bacterium]